MPIKIISFINQYSVADIHFIFFCSCITLLIHCCCKNSDMSCFFCKSINHVSHNCDIYVSDESRQNNCSEQNFCCYCLTSLSNGHVIIKDCNQKCFISFSKIHHTVYCPERFALPNFFLPNIDGDLLRRFMELFKVLEYYSMTFSSPNILNFIQLKPLKVTSRKHLSFSYPETFSDSDLVVASTANLQSNWGNYYRISNDIKPVKTIIFHIKHLEIRASILLSSQEFLQLLSSKTKRLKCRPSEFYGKISFSDILKKAPNLEDIDIYQTNIEVNNLWPEEFMQYNQVNDLYDLWISVADLNFNTESLVALMKKKAVNIYLYITLPSHNNDIKKATEAARNKLSKYFVPSKCESKRFIRVSCFCENGNYGDFEYESYVLEEP